MKIQEVTAWQVSKHLCHSVLRKKSLETWSALLLSAFCSPESQLAHEKGYVSFMHVTLQLLLLTITAFVFSAVTSGTVGLGHSENGCSIIFSPLLGTNHRKSYIPAFTFSKTISTHISLKWNKSIQKYTNDITSSQKSSVTVPKVFPSLLKFESHISLV